MNLNKLYQRINNLKISLYDTTEDSVKAASIEYDNHYAIFLNYKKLNTTDDLFIHAAHEWGHCKTGALHKLDSPFDLIAKHERYADQAAVEEFLPPEKIREAMAHGCEYSYEISEYLDIPEEFVIKAIKIYRLTERI